MYHPTDRVAHTTAFVTPVVEHWLEREIAQWVHPMNDQSDDPSHHELHLTPRLIWEVWSLFVMVKASYSQRWYCRFLWLLWQLQRWRGVRDMTALRTGCRAGDRLQSSTESSPCHRCQTRPDTTTIITLFDIRYFFILKRQAGLTAPIKAPKYGKES